MLISLYCMATFGILELWRVVEWLCCYICQLCVHTFFVLWNVLAFKRSAFALGVTIANVT